jgi:hypothetical protein
LVINIGEQGAVNNDGKNEEKCPDISHPGRSSAKSQRTLMRSEAAKHRVEKRWLVLLLSASCTGARNLDSLFGSYNFRD